MLYIKNLPSLSFFLSFVSFFLSDLCQEYRSWTRVLRVVPLKNFWVAGPTFKGSFVARTSDCCDHTAIPLRVCFYSEDKHMAVHCASNILAALVARACSMGLGNPTSSTHRP